MWLAMFTVTGTSSNPTSTNLTLGAQYNIVTDVPDNAGNHNGGALRFGLDGKLYLSIGDDAGGCTAQNMSSALGCVWRIDVSSLPGVGAGPPAKSTLIPAGNPYAGPTDNARLVWCHGLRNPFRFHIDSADRVPLHRRRRRRRVGGVRRGHDRRPEPRVAVVRGERAAFELRRYRAGVSPSDRDVEPLPRAPPRSCRSGAIATRPAAPPTSAPPTRAICFYADYYAAAIRRLKYNGTTWVTPPAGPWSAERDRLGDRRQCADRRRDRRRRRDLSHPPVRVGVHRRVPPASPREPERAADRDRVRQQPGRQPPDRPCSVPSS